MSRIWFGFCWFREEHYLEYSHRLEAELESLRGKTTLKVDQLRAQTKEMYDRENRVLSGSMDTAMMERDRALASEKEVAKKHVELLKEWVVNRNI